MRTVWWGIKRKLLPHSLTTAATATAREAGRKKQTTTLMVGMILATDEKESSSDPPRRRSSRSQSSNTLPLLLAEMQDTRLCVVMRVCQKPNCRRRSCYYYNRSQVISDGGLAANDDQHQCDIPKIFRAKVEIVRLLLKHCDQLLGRLGNVEGTLDHLLGHETLV